MKKFFSFVVIFCLSVVLFSSCGGSKKDGSEGYTIKELFHNDNDEAQSCLNRPHWITAGPDGKLYLDGVSKGRDITGFRYVNVPDEAPVKGDLAIVWKHGDRYLLVKCDSTISFLSRASAAKDWCKKNLGDEPQTVK